MNNYYTFSNYYLKKRSFLYDLLFLYTSLFVVTNSFEKNRFKNYVFLSLFFIYAQWMIDD